ncbi:MAG TPA: glycosyltransferase family 39 protein [Polyangiaceae bacterium]|nr:glycosyltransferase family 39 protein [Polyangiaceae bacterium]
MSQERSPDELVSPAVPGARHDAIAADRPNAEVMMRVLVGALAACIAYLFAQLLMYRYGRDQGIYATVADTILRGGMPYRDAWDFKPPGIFVIYAAARALFGTGQWSIRVFEVIGLASTTTAFCILARRFFGDWRVGIIGGALAVLVHCELEFWHTAQPESFGGMLTAWAIVLATFEPSQRDPRARTKTLRAWAGAGLLYGATFLLKPPLAGGAVVSSLFAAYSAWQKSRQGSLAGKLRDAATPVAVMAASSLALVVMCLAWFAARGAFHDLYQTLFVFTPHYTKLGWEDATIPGMVYLALEEGFTDFSSINTAGIVAAMVLVKAHPREREGVLHVVLVVIMQLGGVAMQGKFFPYHYGASLLLLSLFAGLGVYKVWQRAIASWLGVAAFATALPVVIFARSATRNTQTDFFDRCIARQRQLFGLSDTTRDELDAKLYSVADVSYGANRLVAEHLRARLGSSDLVFIWGFEPIIYDLSERRPASRYIYDVPQRVSWFKDEARADLMSELDLHPPKAIVVEHRDVFPVVTGDVIDSADTLQKFPALSARLRERYELETTIEDFDVYLAKN